MSQKKDLFSQFHNWKEIDIVATEKKKKKNKQKKQNKQNKQTNNT